MPKSAPIKGKDSPAKESKPPEEAQAPAPVAPPLPGVPPAPGAHVPPDGVRRAPGQKEVIPFAWKVCGYSTDGYTLTLFKSVERADCEAQIERLMSEAYYEGLAIYTIDEPVESSPRAKQLQAVSKKKEAAAKKKADHDKAARKAANAARNKARKPAPRTPPPAAKKKSAPIKKTKTPSAAAPTKTKGSRPATRATKRVSQKRSK
jgi:hypothetical protein